MELDFDALPHVSATVTCVHVSTVAGYLQL
jgi:hypothetical protein